MRVYSLREIAHTAYSTKPTLRVSRGRGLDVRAECGLEAGSSLSDPGHVVPHRLPTAEISWTNNALFRMAHTKKYDEYNNFYKQRIFVPRLWQVCPDSRTTKFGKDNGQSCSLEIDTMSCHCGYSQAEPDLLREMQKRTFGEARLAELVCLHAPGHRPTGHVARKGKQTRVRPRNDFQSGTWRNEILCICSMKSNHNKLEIHDTNLTGGITTYEKRM